MHGSRAMPGAARLARTTTRGRARHAAAAHRARPRSRSTLRARRDTDPIFVEAVGVGTGIPATRGLVEPAARNAAVAQADLGRAITDRPGATRLPGAPARRTFSTLTAAAAGARAGRTRGGFGPAHRRLARAETTIATRTFVARTAALLGTTTRATGTGRAFEIGGVAAVAAGTTDLTRVPARSTNPFLRARRRCGRAVPSRATGLVQQTAATAGAGAANAALVAPGRRAGLTAGHAYPGCPRVDARATPPVCAGRDPWAGATPRARNTTSATVARHRSGPIAGAVGRRETIVGPIVR